MKIFIEKQNFNLTNLMRQLGYVSDRKSDGEQSFSRSLREGRFPRFHIYVGDWDEKWLLKLHLDQKAASYDGQTAHGGEYKGPLVEKEIDRIKKTVKFLNEQKKVKEKQKPKSSKKSLWSRLFH